MGSHQRSARIRRGSGGVTLVELMVAVAIVGILTALAYPSYQRYVARTHRSAARACLSQYVQFMERYYTTNLTYVAAAPSLGCRAEGNMDRHYTFDVIDVAQGRYTVAATPINTQAALDNQCGILRIDSTGARTISGSGDVEHCW